MSYLDLDQPYPRLSLMVASFDRPCPRLRMVVAYLHRPYPRLRMVADMLSNSIRQGSTKKPTTVSFNVIQIISGISLEQFNTILEFDPGSLREGIADSMTDVLASTITSFQVTGPIFPSSISESAVSASSLELHYKVVVSSFMTAGVLMSQLAAAFSDGPFNVYLHDGTFDILLENSMTAPKIIPASPRACSASASNPLLLPPSVPLRAPYLQEV